MNVSLDLTRLTPAQLSRLGTVALLIRAREQGRLAGRIGASMTAAVDAERMQRIARAAPRLQSVALDVDQDAVPDDTDAELQNAVATLTAVRDSAGTDAPARDLWNELLIGLVELRDQRHASRHAVIDLVYRSRVIPDDDAA